MKADLSESLKDKYEIVGDHANHIESSYGTIRFSSLTEARAEQLIAKGCPFIQKLPNLVEKIIDTIAEQTTEGEIDNIAEGKPGKKEKKAPIVDQ